MTQVQTAQQQSVSIQIVQAGAQLAGASIQGGQGVPSPSAGTVTQIQVGCVAQCFEVSSSNPVTAAAGEEIVADLESLLTPPDPPSAAPVPGIEQSVTTQTSCQEQSSGPSQVESASQSSTTVQLVDGPLPVIESSLVGSGSGPGAVSQTVQSIWQLQIGCLFYCTASEQIQDADESSTTVIGVSGESAGSDGVVATVTQVIWQIQVGCLAWCYGATQVQQASAQNTLVSVSPPPTVPSPPDPEPVSDPGPTNSPPAATVADPPPTPVDEPTVVPPPLSFPTDVGRAALMMAVTRSASRANSRPATATTGPATKPLASVQPVERWRASITVTRVVDSADRATPHREHVAGHAGHAARVSMLEARAGGGPSLSVAALVLALIAAVSIFATFRARADGRSER
ncbi:MAG TPA: hypothetical protein VMF57_07455 [Solirubrobacteraceae bacterium]|nr:hypothetical protein [Solirubrobacteraceae bacterium]